MTWRTTRSSRWLSGTAVILFLMVGCSGRGQMGRGADLYHLVGSSVYHGSGVKLAFVIPSLDLVATLNGRTPNSMRDQVTAEFLRLLFAFITQQYVTCDGHVMNGGPPYRFVASPRSRKRRCSAA